MRTKRMHVDINEIAHITHILVLYGITATAASYPKFSISLAHIAVL